MSWSTVEIWAKTIPRLASVARWRSSAGTPFISLVAAPSLRKKTRKSCCAASRAVVSQQGVAVGTVGGLVVTLKALRFPIDRVSLTTALELDAYLIGARKRRERETRAHPEG
jgi:hypothetical protein